MEEAQKGRDRARLHSATAKWQSACNTQNACMRGDMGEQESSPMSPSSFAALLLCSSAPLLLCCGRRCVSAMAASCCTGGAAGGALLLECDEVRTTVADAKLEYDDESRSRRPATRLLQHRAPLLQHASWLCLWHTARILTAALLRRHAASRASGC